VHKNLEDSLAENLYGLKGILVIAVRAISKKPFLLESFFLEVVGH